MPFFASGSRLNRREPASARGAIRPARRTRRSDAGARLYASTATRRPPTKSSLAPVSSKAWATDRSRRRKGNRADQPGLDRVLSDEATSENAPPASRARALKAPRSDALVFSRTRRQRRGTTRAPRLRQRRSRNQPARSVKPARTVLGSRRHGVGEALARPDRPRCSTRPWSNRADMPRKPPLGARRWVLARCASSSSVFDGSSSPST